MTARGSGRSGRLRSAQAGGLGGEPDALFVAHGHGGGERMLVSTVNPVTYRWSPRGHQLVVTWSDGERGHVEAVDATGGTVTVSPLRGDYAVLRWLPSGLIAWHRTRYGHSYDIVVTRPDGRDARTLGSGDDRGDFGSAGLRTAAHARPTRPSRSPWRRWPEPRRPAAGRVV